MTFQSLLSRVLTIALYVGISGQSLADTPSPTSEEYLRNTGLATINVEPAWSSTTGSGATVASLDTGARVSHFELQGRLAAGSSGGDVDAGGGHGTSIAGIIASNFNNQGTVGVAYDAQVLSIGVANSSRFAGAASAAAGFNIAASRGDVKIISFTVGTIFSEPLNSSIINAMNVGKAVFIRAGNDFQANPDVPPSVYDQFNGRGIIVGAYNPNTGTIADLSNKAGGAANVYLAAPGVGIVAPGNASDDAFVGWTGSSVATAHVAGAAALLLSQNPGLSNQQIVEILLGSATDIDAPGVDAVSGHGLLNVAAAVGAQGDVKSSTDSSAAIIGVAALAAAAAGGYFWIQNKKAKESLETALVFDSYDRPYIMNLNQALNVKNETPKLFDVMNMFDRQTRTVDVAMSESLSLSMHARTANPTDYIFLKDSDPFLESDDELRDEDLSLKMAGNYNNGLSFNMQHNYAPSSGFDNVGNLSLSENFIWSSSYGSQYMGFGSIADSMSVGYQPNKKVAFKFGANRLDDGLEHGLSSESAMLQGSYFPTEKTSVSLRVSNLYEDGSLLGGASGGAFSVAHANTTALGLTGKYRVFEKFSLFASFTQGYTGVKEQQGSFLQGFSGLGSQSWGTGVIGSNLFRYNDRAGFAISSPLRISNGDADLIVPQSLDSSRNVISSQTRVSLSPEGKEIDLEAFYRMNLNHRTQLGTSLAYRSTPEDINNVGEGLSVFTTVGLMF